MHRQNLGLISFLSTIGSAISLRVLFALLGIASIVGGAPDPDIFDGRVPASGGGSASSGEGAPEFENQETEASNPSGRDFDEIGGFGAASHEVQSDAGLPSEGGASTRGGNSEGASSAGTTGTDASGGSSERDFGSIGRVGSQSREQTIETNSSKLTSQTSDASGRSSGGSSDSTDDPRASNSEPQQQTGVGSGGSKPWREVEEGDYGDNLPPGL